MAHEGRILLVEDQREWQDEFQAMLRDYPYKIKIADKLQKAKDLLQHHIFDLVLLDLRLTDWEEGNFDGWNLMKTIKECRKEQGTQVIIVSAYGEPEHVREGFKKYNIVDYFDKKRLNEQEFKDSVSVAIDKAFQERDDIVESKYS